MAAWSSSETRLHGTIAIQHEGGRRLQHLEVSRDVGAVRQVNVEVTHPGVVGGNVSESLVHARATRTRVVAELQKSCDLAERISAQPLRLDHLMLDVSLWTRLHPSQHGHDSCRQRE